MLSKQEKSLDTDRNYPPQTLKTLSVPLGWFDIIKLVINKPKMCQKLSPSH